jgi:enoyl-CoA hydratase
MNSFTHLHYQQQENIVCITIDRPDALNALNQALLLELERAFDMARDDATIAGVIVTGAGKAFVAGADIAELVKIGAVEGERFTRQGQRLFDGIAHLGKPVIAAVNGYAFGGGCELALACTLRIASNEAKFAFPEVSLGVIPGFGGTQRLPRLIGAGRALQMILTATPVDAAEAYRVGLVNEVTSASELLERARAILQRICANAPVAVRLATRAVHLGLDMSLEGGQALESALFAVCASTADKLAGTNAFLAKQAPRFTGV